jgi:hypothetical protein
MKHIIMKPILSLLIFSMFIKTALHAQTIPNTTPAIAKVGAVITFDETVHDFGMIAYNGPGTHVYVITNTGTEPLIIYNCVKGCGCTQVDWTKEPINPGQKGMVKATYNTKKIGEFNRGVDVYSNDFSKSKINIRLKGLVEVVPGGEVPPIITESKTKKDNEEKW